MTALSELLPAGGAGKVMDFVASGTLPNGSPVVLKTDGTVEVVSGSSASESIPAGSEVVFNTADTHYTSVAFDPNNANKFVVVYHDGGNGSYGTAIVGTVSGTSISFGSEYVFNNTGNTSYTSIAFDPSTANKFVVVYVDISNSSYGTAIAGTISGTSISFGTEVVFNSAQSIYSSVAFDPNTANKFVVAYQDAGNANYGAAIVGTVSGTTISFGSEVVFNTGAIYYTSVAFDPNTAGKFVLAYTDSGNLKYGTSVVGTVSGTSISFGSEVVFNSGMTWDIVTSFDSNTAGKFVVAYRDGSSSHSGRVVVGTISGTSTSFGTEVVFNSGISSYVSIAFDPNTAGKFIVAYEDGGNANYGTVIIGTVSGTSASFGSEVVFNSGQSDYTSIAFDPNTSGKFAVAYRDTGNSSYGTAILGQLAVNTANLTSTNFVGITTESISDTATGSITLQGGVSTNQSSLTVGSNYYVQPDGTLATTAGTPSVVAGQAISSTSLQLQGV